MQNWNPRLSDFKAMTCHTILHFLLCFPILIKQCECRNYVFCIFIFSIPYTFRKTSEWSMSVDWVKVKEEVRALLQTNNSLSICSLFVGPAQGSCNWGLAILISTNRSNNRCYLLIHWTFEHFGKKKISIKIYIFVTGKQKREKK